MAATPSSSIRIGIYGRDTSDPRERHGCGLWPAGVAAALTYAEAEPVVLPERTRTCWDDHLEPLHGIVVVGHDKATPSSLATAEEICAWAHDHKLPILGIDHGMLALNSSHGGLNYTDLPRELPEALQHRHPP